jgi:hypothetical protein
LGLAVGGSITLDQKGNLFVGPGVSFDRGVSLMAGWLVRSKYSERAVENLVTGESVTGTIASGLGGGITASPRSGCAAIELGVANSSGVSGSYGVKVGNILDWLRL